MKQTEIFHILSDETRLRALSLMTSKGELCVCELVFALDLSQPKISRHMAALRESRLVTSRRVAQWVFYNVSEELPGWQRKVLSGAMSAIVNEPDIKKDLARLGKMKDRPDRAAA